jgi:hypothetical protein
MPPRKPPPRQGTPPGRTAWHVLLANLLKERAPSSFEVLTEVSLGRQPPRIDVLLLRRHRSRRPVRPARVLRRLWGRIRRLGVIEYKSPADPLRQGDLAKLLAYGLWLLAEQPRLAPQPVLDLTLGWIVPVLTPTLRRELSLFGWSLGAGEQGYYPVTGAWLPFVVIVASEVSAAEHDELLGVLADGKVHSREAITWWHQQTGQSMGKLEKMQGYDQIVEKFVGSLTPEQIVAGIKSHEDDRAVEKFVDALTPEQLAASLNAGQRRALKVLLDQPARKAKPAARKATPARRGR